MPLWTPTKEWEGQDAYIIGGGSSLKSFDFNRLRGLNVIGCNEAFRLGPEIVKICLFGGASWFHTVKFDLEKFPGKTVCISPTLMFLNTSWFLQMQREKYGIYSGPVLGWNNSTGGAAVNLAVSLGARRIFLLGFDLKANDEGKTHWHQRYNKTTKNDSFLRFIKGFEEINRALRLHPNVKVFNV